MSLDVTPEFNAKKNAETSQPLWLYTVHDYDGLGTDLRFAESRSAVIFDGQSFIAFPISHDQIGESSTGEIDAIRVNISNVSRLIQSYLEGYDLRSKRVTVTQVWADALDDPDNKVEFDYFIDSYTADQDVAVFILLPKTDTLGQVLPARFYSRNSCRWIFKSDECGYSGSETECNKTKQRCKALANFTRFGGFPSVPTRQINVG